MSRAAETPAVTWPQIGPWLARLILAGGVGIVGYWVRDTSETTQRLVTKLDNLVAAVADQRATSMVSHTVIDNLQERIARLEAHGYTVEDSNRDRQVQTQIDKAQNDILARLRRDVDQLQDAGRTPSTRR